VIVTLVLRLVGERLEMGELVGQARLVARDEEATVHDVGELIAFARRATDGGDGGGPGDGGPEPSPPAAGWSAADAVQRRRRPGGRTNQF